MIFVCKLPMNTIKGYLFSILSLSGPSSGSPCRVCQIMALIKTVSKTKCPLFYIYLTLSNMKSSQINHCNLCLITAELLVHVYVFCLFKIIIHCWLLYSMKWKVSQLLVTGLFDFYPLQLYMIKLVSYLWQDCLTSTHYNYIW
jgi:hypothetical protein